MPDTEMPDDNPPENGVPQNDAASHNEALEAAINRFIALANDLKNEGQPVNLVITALMTSAGIYATYAAAGNEGHLKDSGIAKVVELFRNNLIQVQNLKKAVAANRNRSA